MSPSTYHKFATPCGWLQERIPDEKVLAGYGVFLDHSNARKSAYGSVLLPIRKSKSGQVVGSLGRRIGVVDDEHRNCKVPTGLQKSLFLSGAAEIQAGRFDR